MKPFHAGTYYTLGSLLCNMKRRLAEADDDDKDLQKKREELPVLLASISRTCAEVHLEVASEYVSKIRRRLTEMTNSDLSSKMNELSEVITIELKKQLFMFLPPEEARFYGKNDLLKPLASQNFPSALKEITEAGSCYACGLNTASVFHSMRALEQPFRTLAKDLRVTLSKDIELATWGDLYREVDKKLGILRNQRHTTKRDSALDFYCRVNLEFGYFKDAWRNFVAHDRKDYDGPQAVSALNHVIAFIETLANNGMKEYEKKK